MITSQKNSRRLRYVEECRERKRELYLGCTNFFRLTFFVKIMHIMILNKRSNKFFDMLLKLLKNLFFDGTGIPTLYYEAKTTLGYESIHICRSDCTLVWKVNTKLDKCSVCGENDGK